MSDESIIPGLSLAPAVLNEKATEDARNRIEGALSKARARRDEARAGYGTSIENTLKAIDETTQALQKAHEGQWNLPLMAFGAGLLKTTPGVASNFGTEFSSGLEAAIPAIARQRMSDNEFLSRIGELKRLRETTAGEPFKLNRAEEDKEIDRLLQQQGTIESAAMRAVPANLRMQAQFEKQWDSVKKAAAQAYQNAIKDVEKTDGTKLTGEEKALLERLFQYEAVKQNNAGLDPKSPNYINPEKVGLKEEDVARGTALRNTLVSDQKTPEERAYSEYARKAKEAGQQPLPMEEWKTQNAARAAAQKKIAEAGAEAELQLPQFEASAKQFAEQIDKLIEHKGLPEVVGGIKGKYPEWAMVGPLANSFMAEYKRLQSMAFLQGVEKMRGTGPLSDKEGAKVESLVGSLSRSVDPEDFKARLREIKEQVGQLQIAVAKDLAAKGQAATGRAPAGGSRRAPKGTVIEQDGKKFIMGDKDWEPYGG